MQKPTSDFHETQPMEMWFSPTIPISQTSADAPPLIKVFIWVSFQNKVTNFLHFLLKGSKNMEIRMPVLTTL